MSTLPKVDWVDGEFGIGLDHVAYGVFTIADVTTFSM